MENDDQRSFDTDLEDDSDQSNDCVLPRLSFDEKLIAHRSNRGPQTFGQINIPWGSHTAAKTKRDDQRLVAIPQEISYANVVQRFDMSCHLLETVVDEQLKATLEDDHISVISRSLCFNDIRAFATAIEANLESLTLHSVGLTARSVVVLCQGLKKCVHLQLLDVSSNKIGQRGFDSLIDTLVLLPSLLSLSLADCGIQDSYGRRIGKLCRHEKIAEMNLSGNAFEEMACIFLANGLAENTSLTYLNLSWNLIRSFASIAVLRAFETNRTLTEFDLSWSGLGYDGSLALRRVLMANKCLKQLNISHCSIEWTSAKLISEGLAKNTTLTALNLAFNPLTTHGAQFIVKALSETKSAVATLDLSGLTVFASTARLAEQIARKRPFAMMYEFETSVHDRVGGHKVTKADSTRKIMEHISSRNWRTLDYFRMLENKDKAPAVTQTVIHQPNTTRGMQSQSIDNIHRRLNDQKIEPLTYKDLNHMIYRQRMRDRSLRARQERQEKETKKRNQKILDTVNRHFPDIDIVSKQEKHIEAIAQLAKPRT